MILELPNPPNSNDKRLTGSRELPMSLSLPHQRELSPCFCVKTSGIFSVDVRNAIPSSGLTLNSSKKKNSTNRHYQKTAMEMARAWGQEVY
jgi:hypothetical protein